MLHVYCMSMLNMDAGTDTDAVSGHIHGHGHGYVQGQGHGNVAWSWTPAFCESMYNHNIVVTNFRSDTNFREIMELMYASNLKTLLKKCRLSRK